MLGFIISLLPFTFLKDTSFISKKNKYISVIIYDVLILLLCMVINKDFSLISIGKNIIGLLLSYKLIIDLIDGKLDKKKLTKIFIVFLIYLGGTLLVSIILGVYAGRMGYEPEKIPANTQIVFELILQGILATILGIMYKDSLVKDFKEFKKNYLKYLVKALGTFLVAFVLSLIVSSIINILTGLKNSTNEEIVQSYIANSPIISLISMGLFAPFVEEIVFRKTHYDAFKYNKVLFIIASAVSFGMAHVLFSATTLAEYSFVISYMILGGALAKCFADSDNYFPGFIVHMLNNVVLVIISIL